MIERPNKRTLFVEIKSARWPDPVEVRRLARLAKDHGRAKPSIWCTTGAAAVIEGVEVLPWHAALNKYF